MVRMAFSSDLTFHGHIYSFPVPHDVTLITAGTAFSQKR
jgi:hypothetical protein